MAISKNYYFSLFKMMCFVLLFLVLIGSSSEKKEKPSSFMLEYSSSCKATELSSSTGKWKVEDSKKYTGIILIVKFDVKEGDELSTQDLILNYTLDGEIVKSLCEGLGLSPTKPNQCDNPLFSWMFCKPKKNKHVVMKLERSPAPMFYHILFSIPIDVNKVTLTYKDQVIQSDSNP